MDFKLLEKSFKELKNDLDVLSSFYEGGLCVMATRLAYLNLVSKGMGDDLRIAGGKAMFSVNSGADGLVDYGYSKNSFVGNYIGHFWLVYKNKWVIDFSLPYIKKQFLHDNKKRGIKDNRFELSKKLFVPFELIYTYDELFNGKIGHHYLEIKGRGEMLWNDIIPEI